MWHSEQNNLFLKIQNVLKIYKHQNFEVMANYTGLFNTKM